MRESKSLLKIIKSELEHKNVFSIHYALVSIKEILQNVKTLLTPNF